MANPSTVVGAGPQQDSCGQRLQAPHLIEDVVVALGIIDLHHPGALQQVGAHSCPADAPCLVELDLHEFSKARGVVIPGGLRIAKGLQQGVGLQNLQACPCILSCLCLEMQQPDICDQRREKSLEEVHLSG